MLHHNFNLSLTLFLTSCLMFSLFHKHLLLTLINLEFMMLNLIYNTYTTTMTTFFMPMYFMSIFLTVIVCESVLGLSLLIYFVRNKGNDYLKSLNLIKW